MSAQITVGIDIGTTNSAVTIMYDDLIEPSFPGNGAQLMSCIFWGEGKDPIVGLPALRAGFKAPERIATHFKRRLYDSPDEPAYSGHTAIEGTSIVLTELMKVASLAEPYVAKCLNGDPAARSRLKLVLAAPANWGTTQHESLRRAARLAGLEIDAIWP